MLLCTFPAHISVMPGKLSNCFQRAHLHIFKKTEEEKKSAVIHFVIQAFTLFLFFFSAATFNSSAFSRRRVLSFNETCKSFPHTEKREGRKDLKSLGFFFPTK